MKPYVITTTRKDTLTEFDYFGTRKCIPMHSNHKILKRKQLHGASNSQKIADRNLKKKVRNAQKQMCYAEVY